MLLIYPPVAKACEPPAGIARLAGAIQAKGFQCRLWDANLEGQLWLMDQKPVSDDTWTSRAWRSRDRHLAALRKPETYNNHSRYSSAVNDLNRLLLTAGKPLQAAAGLADFHHATMTPVDSRDLLTAAASPELNPFNIFFKQRLPELLTGITTVGISLTFISQALCCFSLIGLIRKHYPQIKIVLGGGLVTSWLSRPDWQNPFGSLVDQMIAGPGEVPLLEYLGHNSTEEPATPLYDQLPLTRYLSPGLILPYSTSSGCWWNRCTFCPERAEGNRYKPLPFSRVIREIRFLIEKYRPVLLHLLDNALAPAMLQHLIDDPPGVPWYSFVRFEKQLLEKEFCMALRQSGCVMLKLGIESGDQAVLNELHKGTDLVMAGHILENLRESGIMVYGYLMFGTPAEDMESAHRTLAFVEKHHAALGFLNLAIFNMPIYGNDVKDYETELFYSGDLSLYTGFRHKKGWGRAEARRFLKQKFTRSPEIAEIIRRVPPYFTSNHAAFFNVIQGDRNNKRH